VILLIQEILTVESQLFDFWSSQPTFWTTIFIGLAGFFATSGAGSGDGDRRAFPAVYESFRSGT
jgi:hypothetical protein